MSFLENVAVDKFKGGSLIVKGISEDVLKKIINPFLPKFNLADVVQIIIGASILAVPVGFTEETWKLGEGLPLVNIFYLFIVSLLFISLFTHLNYHRVGLRKSGTVFLKRVFFTYVLSFLVVAGLLTIIQRAPWQADFILAIKRVVIVTFPSSMSAAVADVLK